MQTDNFIRIINKPEKRVMNMLKNRLKSLLLIFLLPVSSNGIISGNLTERYSGKYPDVPYGLMVEYIREPEKTVINDNSPAYSWIVPDAAVYQKGYQILVSSDKSNIDSDIGDIWDSKQVMNNISVNLKHGGEPLKPNT
ncbi:MAG: hypothetical protein GX820_00990, partial [Bacteroidales bacterium]|nr:hypothetical protein [Bacteroidales bacterium]